MPYRVLDPQEATELPLPVPNPAGPFGVEPEADEYGYDYDYDYPSELQDLPVASGITLGEARQELRAMLEERDDIEDDRLTFWLNRAYMDLATSLHKQDELKASMGFSTEDEQALYLLPPITFTTLYLTRRVDDLEAFPTGGVPLDKIDLGAYRRLREREDPPDRFFRFNNLLVLWPTPDDEYEMVLDFRFEPNKLTEDWHIPVIRSEWHEAWLLLARKKVLGALAEWEASLAANNEFVGHVRVRKDREQSEEENRIVSSSAPHNRASLRRRLFGKTRKLFE